MKTKIKNQHDEIKAINVSDWVVSFWLIKRKIVRKENQYTGLRVKIDEKLQGRFRRYLKKQLQSKDFHVTEYDFNNADGDDVLFTTTTTSDDFVKVSGAIAEVINEGFDNKLVTKYEELLNTWLYIVLFEKDGKYLYACRKIHADTQPKKVDAKNIALFKNKQLIDIDDKEVFLIYSKFDFFVYDGTIFIANKRRFESAMNFREGMKVKAEEVFSAFDELNIFDNVKIIRKFVGINLHHLRKLSSIRKSAYYEQPDYMKKLIKVSAQEKWGLKIVNDKIVVEEDTVELLLKLLNNDRLRSPINDELFDSAAKAPVSKGSGD